MAEWWEQDEVVPATDNWMDQDEVVSAEQPKPGFLGTIIQKGGEREQVAQGHIDLAMMGQENPVAAGLQAGAQGTGFLVRDIGGEILNKAVVEPTQSVFEGRRQLREGGLPAQDPLSKGIDVASMGLKSLGNIASTVAESGAGQLAKGASSYVTDQYSRLKQAAPNLVGGAEGLVNMGVDLVGLSPMYGPTKTAFKNALSSSPVEMAEKVAVGGMKSLDGKPKTSPVTRTTAAEDFETGSELYKTSAREGVQFAQGEVETLRAKLSSLTPKTDLEREYWVGSAPGHVERIIASSSREAPNLNGLLAARSKINSEMSVASKAGNKDEVERLMRVKEVLDETMMSGKTETWQEANHYWKKASLKQDLEQIVLDVRGPEGSAGMAQQANALDRRITKYLNSWKGRLLSADERSALEAVIKSGGVDEVRRNWGSRLSSYVATGLGGAIGGPKGALVGNLLGMYASNFARNSAMMSRLEKLDKFFEVVDSRQFNPVKDPGAPWGVRTATPKLTDTIKPKKDKK